MAAAPTTPGPRPLPPLVPSTAAPLPPASDREASRRASVGAEAERARKEAQDALKGVEGRGNALSDVALTGKPRRDTGGHLVALVSITNKTDQTASYAVQVDFVDPDGKVAETQYVGARELEPGGRAEPLAISRSTDTAGLSPKLGKAQRY
ncbi:hypothetical protein [Streptomyces sp. NPDC058045]|uniref:hypothetical protein n=1 Tax=Streptomyces sp. NPDC058045 TaxID=3346311 RepID=UPI0036E59440